MASLWLITGVVIPVASLVLSVLINLYPKESKKILKKTKKGFWKVKRHLLTFSQSVNYFNMLVGAGVIVVVLLMNHQSTLIDQESKLHIGTQPICSIDDNVECHFPVEGNQAVFFRGNIKFDSVNQLDLTYSSQVSQTARVGFGYEGNYSHISINLPATNGHDHRVTVFDGKGEEEICPSCFNGVITQGLGSVLAMSVYIVVEPSADLEIKSLEFISEGLSMNVVRMVALLVGAMYIFLGAFSLIRFKR